MARRLVRGFCTAAAAAVAAGSLVAGGPAAAQPGRLPLAPGPAAGSSGPESTQGRPAPDRPTGTKERSVSALLTDLQRLYRQAEDADVAYRAAHKRLRQRREAVGGLDDKLAKARRALHESRAAAGRLARIQYQGSAELSPYVKLLLSRDPQHALEQSDMLQRVSAARAAVVRRLTDDERRAQRLTAAARRTLKAQETLARRQQRQRAAVHARLSTVERLLATSHTGRQSADGRDGDGRNFPQSKTTPPDTQGPQAAQGATQPLLAKALRSSRPPSLSGSKALRYALRQIGKPYQWGATGPDAFDCSGLTSQAWASAGHPIPRTSQEQWARLPRVPMEQLRPGDLVIYYPTATHVALYVGGGMVVQAPRSGERIKVSPVRTNPVLGAVRPDQGEPPL